MKTRVILLAIIIAAIAAPTAVYFGVTAYTRYRVASVAHADLKRQQRDLGQYSAQVDEYNRFAARVEGFIQNAKSAGVADEAWDRHHVDIKQRILTFDELDQFIAGASSGDNYYFLPDKLTIQAPGADTGNNPFRHGRVNTSPDEVGVSLVGDFLVRVK